MEIEYYTLNGIKSRIKKRTKSQIPDFILSEAERLKNQDLLQIPAWNLELGIWSLEFET
jgi:hypothetical protein